MNLATYFDHLYQVVVSSEILAGHFEKRHDDVIQDIEGYKHLPNFEEMFMEERYQDHYGRYHKCYLINRDGFSLLAKDFTGQKALDWKSKYFAAFNAFEKEYNSPEKIMARALLVASKEVSNLKLEVEKMKPKALFADAVSASKTSILIGELAKLLKQNGVDIGRTRLFERLRNEGYLIKAVTSERNLPHAKVA